MESDQLGLTVRRRGPSKPSCLATRKMSKRVSDTLPTSEIDVKRFKPMGSYQKQKPGKIPDMFSNTSTSAARKLNDAKILADELNESIAKGGEPVDVDRISGSLFEADNEEMDYGLDFETESCITGVDHDPAFLVDFKDVNLKQTKTKGGAPTKPILDLLLRRCYLLSDPKQKVMYRCVADDCGHTLANRGVRRTIKHAMECEKLDAALKERAFEEVAPFAPSNRLEATLSHDDKMAVDADDNRVEESAKDGSEPTDTFKSFRAKGTKQRQAAADLAIVKLFCVAGLPTYLATYPEWHNVLTTLWPAYKPADRTKLEDVQIVAEAAFVRKKMLDILRAEQDLTVSYDGGTSRGREAFWTIHVSTSDHRVYFVAGREATRESHTGQWIRNTVNTVSIISVLSPSLTELTFLFR